MEGHVCSTVFRKSTVTKVHADHKDLRGDLADLMGHKTSTAERFYRLREKEEACIEAANNLTSIMRETQEPVSQPKTPATATKSLSQTSFKRDHLSWREEDVNAMKDLFSEEIKEKCITMEVVRNKIRDHPTLKQMNDKRVLDKIRSEWQNSDLADEEAAGTCSMPTTGLPVQTETLSDKMGRFFKACDENNTCSSSEVVGPSNSSYISRCIFSDGDKKFLLRVCGGMVTGRCYFKA